ncbi:DNA cytosine methyltransferase [Neobacillus sp. NPDC097160]|uniref:DNA cytosine methyltransferase n=1 Tax=Neobacillus sp. NPDC097160 TaxID=3364298 RepID=UPI00382BFB91
MYKLQVMDLFAGAGGLSNGFEQTNKFEVKIAAEINENARKTYQQNHKSVTSFPKDITKIEFKNKNGTLKDEYQDIDVIIGGPPCQGFSNANRQKNTLISSNNQLVKEYLRAIEDIKPKAFVMENVKTLESEKHKFFVTEDEETILSELDVEYFDEYINIGPLTKNSNSLKSFLVNSYKNKDDLTPYLLNKELLTKLNLLLRHAKKQSENALKDFLSKENNNKYFKRILSNKWQEMHKKFFDDAYESTWNDLHTILGKILEDDEFNINDLTNTLGDVIEIQRIINKISEIIQNNIMLYRDILGDIINITGDNFEIYIKSYNVFSYIKAKVKSLGYKLNEKQYIFNTANYGVPQERKRLILIGVLEEELKVEEVKIPEPIFDNPGDYNKIFDAIGDLEKLPPSTFVGDDQMHRGEFNSLVENNLNQYLNNNSNNMVYNHVRTESREMAQKRFESLTAGQNFHDLDDSLKSTYSDHSRTQNTIYKRLDYNKPSDTVVNVRKSMWIHPKLNRAISIREAARLQSFQDSYKFYGTKDSQYQQVGNAVPPLMARFVAESILESLGIDINEKIKDIINPKMLCNK